MGNCLKNSVEESIENQPLISSVEYNQSIDYQDSLNSVSSPSPFPSSSLSTCSSVTPPPNLFMPTPRSQTPVSESTPVSTKPNTPENKMSMPVKKKRLLNELIIKVPEIKANYRWENRDVEVFSPRKQRFNEERYEKHMKNPNVCQLCETLFPDNTYLQKLDQNEETLYCFNCIKFLSGEKNEDYTIKII
jgi:hypothetical protein